MRYKPLSASFYVGNRARLAQQLVPNSLAVLNANDVAPTNADGTMTNCPNSDMFYLTGVEQEETILVLYPEATDPMQREILFIRETSELIAIWEGKKLSKEEARERTGIRNVQWLDTFESIFPMLAKQADVIYLNDNEHLRAPDVVETRDLRFIKRIKREYPLHQLKRLAPILGKMRQIKQEEEIAAIQKACDHTESAVRRLLNFIKPGVGEWEIEAELAHEFTRLGARRWGFQPIIASGANTCVLHYNTNDQMCREGDLVLIDMGTEYGNYNSDLTRTYPVSGKFTPRQKAVYDAVHRIYQAAFAILRPGIVKRDYEKKVGEVVEKELLALGLITQEDIDKQSPDSPAYRKYYMHGCSHFLGLDVHDVGESNPVIEANMVYTIEPGIYIREEGIGVRLENDVLIGESENIDLMANIPISSDEIEALMQR